MDDFPIGFAEVALALLVVKEAFSLVRAALDKAKNGGSGTESHTMGADCREKFDSLKEITERIETSVVAPDRQPLHVTVRSILARVSKEK